MDRYRPQESTPRERFDALYAELVNDPHPVVEVGIPMRDGAILAADVYLPDPSQLPAPAIVTLNSGYDKSNVMRHTSPVTGRPEPRHLGFEAPWLQSRLFQQNGYVYVINDESAHRVGVYMDRGVDSRLVLRIAERFDAALATGKYDGMFGK